MGTSSMTIMVNEPLRNIAPCVNKFLVNLLENRPFQALNAAMFAVMAGIDARIGATS